VASVIFLVMIDLHLTERIESVGRSIVHEMAIPPGKACVERRKYGASVLIRGIVGGKVRVGQGAWITDSGKFRCLAVPMPDPTTDSMPMLKVLNPARASLELVLRNSEGLGDFPGFVADQGVGEGDVLRNRTRGQPIDKLALDLRELGGSELGKRQLQQGIVELIQGRKYLCLATLNSSSVGTFIHFCLCFKILLIVLLSTPYLIAMSSCRAVGFSL
jgi:hypothetical protein